MIDKRLIAVCDILGFKKMIRNNPLDFFASNVISYFLKALYYSIHKKDPPPTLPSLSMLRHESSIGLAWFSDTVLMYAKDDTDESCRQLIETIAWLLFATNLTHPIKIRCGISYGEVYLDEENEIFIGAPIVEAYEFQEQQNWSGGALDKSAYARIPSHVIKTNPFDWYLIAYDVPLKPPVNDLFLAIDWTRGIHPYTPLDWSEKSKMPTEEDIQTFPDIIEKWKNTKAFHDFACRLCGKGKKSRKWNRGKHPAP